MKNHNFAKKINKMFGIGTGELILIIIVAVMLLGPDKLPGAMRTFGKFMANVKSATNEIKTEIQKSSEVQELQSSIKKVAEPFTAEVERIKNSVVNIDVENTPIMKETTTEIEKLQEDIDELTGPIKRQR
jgi:sec-independent protein translocase protein TatA